jgi:hypothetical protein
MGTARDSKRGFMRRLLSVGILIASTLPLSAQGQQPDPAKLQAEAEKVVSIIKADKAKRQVYCQIAHLSEQMDQAVKENDKKKFEELAQTANEQERQLGPEYLALVESFRDVSLISKEGEKIASMFDKLDESCPH